MKNNNINEFQDPQVEQIKYKNIMIILIIIIFVSIKIFSNKIKFKDFFNFSSISFDIKQIYDIKDYLIFFAIIIPITYLLWKSNIKWAKEQIDILEKNEEKKKKLEEEKRKEEFENKMRGIHFKDIFLLFLKLIIFP